MNSQTHENLSVSVQPDNPQQNIFDKSRKSLYRQFYPGMRWWNEIDENGTSKFTFEHANPALSNSSDSKIFWTLLYATPVVWGVLAVVAFLSLRFQWLLIVIIAIALSYANLNGYSSCEKSARIEYNGAANSSTTPSVGGYMTSLMTN
ncbi:hypothetical protein BB560_004292 [Smittium megazygosporum]|uniref:Golgi apparatus membrane protein TVP23 n=1 Tax=Smittium megazygosporum TaxID=133381 RepID=A0A2T9Z9L6_9FUNG|nr:hypothetical protein BB560_004292 [Smittium megazygosporum]